MSIKGSCGLRGCIILRFVSFSGLIRLTSHHFAREMAASFAFLAVSGCYPSLRGHGVALLVISRLLSFVVCSLLSVDPFVDFLRFVSCLPR